MNRLFRIVILLTITLGVLAPVAPASAAADPIGGLLVIPGTGNDLTALRLRTSAGCPAQATAFYARMTGQGFPPDGQIVTTNTRAGMSHDFGFDVYVALIMRDYAHDNHTTLDGRYDITVFCVDRLTLHSYGEFTGSLEFTTPTTYQAIGAARPPEPPPPPLTLAGDGSALPPDVASPPPVEAPSLATPPDPVVAGGPVPAPTEQPPLGVEPQPPSSTGQLTSERDDTTDQGVPWLVLALALAGGVLVVWVVVTAAGRIRGRRSP